MPVSVRLPDGSEISVNTDDTQAAAAAARTYWQRQQSSRRSQPQPRPTPQRQAQRPRPASPNRSFGAAFVDSVLPTWGDEIAGFGGGLGSLLQGRPYMEGYRRQSADFRKEQAEYRRANPGRSALATASGTAAALAVPMGALSRANTARKAIRQGALSGAAVGAVSGAGNGQGVSERATNAAYSGTMGAAVGAVMGPVANGAASATRWARRNVPGVDAAVRTVTALPNRAMRAITGAPARSAGTEQADRLMARQMAAGNIARGNGTLGPEASPQAIAAEVTRRNAQGVPAMVGDVTDNMRGLTEYASRGMGPGQSRVREAIESRKAGEAARVRQHVQATMPTTSDPIRHVETITQQARERAAPLYAEAYAQPLYRTEAIQGIERTPAFQEALPQAYRNIRNQIDPATLRPRDPAAMGFRDMPDADPNGLPPTGAYFRHPDGDGYVAYDQGLSVEGYDQAIRAMRDSGRAAGSINPLTGRLENNGNSVHINARAADLRQHLMDQNPAYAQAVRGYGDDMVHRDAFRQGGDVGKLTGHEVAAQGRSLPETAHGTWATGAGTSLADEASRYGAQYPNGSVANRVRQMVGDDAKQDAISRMAGDQGNLPGLLDRLESEQQGHLTWQAVNGNSRTAQRQQVDRDLDRAAGIPLSGGAAVSQLINFIAGRADSRFQQDVKARIAQVVTVVAP